MKVFPESSFFREQRASALPSPAEVRALNEASGDDRAASFDWPCPVIIPSLGLFIKYGASVPVTEAETQVLVRELMQGKVPVPEVFGWTEDGGQRFIYMSLIEGDTLQSRFGTMDESERQTVCQELRGMVNAWRILTQDTNDTYVGSVGKQKLHDIFVAHRPKLEGPFFGTDAVQQFQEVCGIDIRGDVPVVFTHNDLCPPNILLSHGPNPRVVAVIDWAQSGWYPSYWEYCKARQVGLHDENFDAARLEEWHTKYLPLVIDPVDEEEYYHPWLFFMLCHI